MKNNATASTVLKIVAALMIISAIFALCFWGIGYGEVYETTMLSNYGKITGNFENNAPEEFVHSFFPQEIDDDFSQIVYHYKAKKGDTYAYECYLEFVIDNPDAYLDFVEKHIQRSASIEFIYDKAFREQSISNVLHLQSPRNDEAVYPIGTAELGKILFSDQQQRIIFVAIGMHDGGGANTVELGHFFSRFQIDPWEYAKSAFASNYYQELGITNEER